MEWSYGVTTCKRRLKTLLPRTLDSLARAGFDQPRVFADGCKPEDIPAELNCRVDVVPRMRTLKTYGNWVLSAWELYVTHPRADRYAVFQDDFVTYAHLRDYLEAAPYPDRGYLNLYTFPANVKDLNGWYRSNQMGLGAVALVFDNQALRALLASEHFVNRPTNLNRGWRAVDGGIVTALKKARYAEYVHNPSLVQHTGEHSSMGNSKQALSPVFRGEGFDARALLPKPEPKPITPAPIPLQGRTRARIGLVGYNARSGLGELNRQIATYCNVDAWLIVPHRTQGVLEPHPDVDAIVCKGNDQRKVDSFLKRVDVVVFCETEYIPGLAAKAKAAGNRVCCVPMHEWMPSGLNGWPKICDVLICPTRHCYDQFAHVTHCEYFPWPVDIQRFRFEKRTVCNRFLFINGHGGVNGRKGAHVVAKALELWPQMPLLVRTQAALNWTKPGMLLDSPAENSELYTQGDVLIAPHTVDGLGLEPREAMSAGMPVITTDGLPWNEIPSLAKVFSKKRRVKFRRPVITWDPDPESLVSVCKGLHGTPIGEYSEQARKWAEDSAWTQQRIERFEMMLTYSAKGATIGKAV